MKHFRLSDQKILLSVAGLVLVAGVVFVLYRNGHAQPDISFSRDVRPILNRRCLACHGGVRAKGDFSLLFPEEAFDTTASGRFAIVPGKPGKSELIRRIRHHDPDVRMPLDGEPLTPEEIDILERWIAEGAKWEDHWAYVPPKPQPLPVVSNPSWVRGGIDRFILARLDQAGMKPSPEAGCAILIRRVSLDLTGLPPSIQEVETFCANPSAGAYERVVDRLLGSPRFGEHWAAMWLDLARYADTKGYEKDAGRSIWRYRDTVIKAFNQDLPFHEFTVRQLAGDLLPGATDEQVLATAFHRNTMTNDEGGTDNEEFRVAALIDRVNTTFEVWQGTTMACVQCHSHPYDPFRHTDYYKLLAFFNNSEDADREDEEPLLTTYSETEAAKVQGILDWFRQNGLGLPAGAPRALSERVHRTLFDHSTVLAVARFDTLNNVTRDSDYVIPNEPGAYLGFARVDLNGFDAVTLGGSVWEDNTTVDLHLDAPEGPRIAHVSRRKTDGKSYQRVLLDGPKGVHDLYVVFNQGGKAGGGQLLNALYLHPADRGADSSQRLAAHARRQELASIRGETTPVMRELPPALRRTTRVFERGNWLVPSDTVAPDVPGTPPRMGVNTPRDRLGLARWLVDKKNPLTARVTVNRFWARLFGRGLVETEEDFGTQGAPPSHPELLDWLALRFMNEQGWSVKKLLKEMVTSSTYRQSSHVSPEALRKDPENRLFARAARIRLSAEQVRDQALAVSGLLSDRMFGPSVMPPQPPGIWKSPYNGQDWTPSEGDDRYRRSLYTYWKRTSPYPSMVSFDSPTREFCVVRRVKTNTPLQALITLNDPVYVEAAQALARRMVNEGGPTPESRMRYGYRLALASAPDVTTLADLTRLYEEALKHYGSSPDATNRFLNPVSLGSATSARSVSASGRKEGTNVSLAALTVVASAILNLDATITRE